MAGDPVDLGTVLQKVPEVAQVRRVRDEMPARYQHHEAYQGQKTSERRRQKVARAKEPREKRIRGERQKDGGRKGLQEQARPRQSAGGKKGQIKKGSNGTSRGKNLDILC